MSFFVVVCFGFVGCFEHAGDVCAGWFDFYILSIVLQTFNGHLTHSVAHPNTDLQEVSIVEGHLRTLEQRFLATLTRTPPEPKSNAGDVPSEKWDGAAWSDRKWNAKTKESNGELTMLGMQR